MTDRSSDAARESIGAPAPGELEKVRAFVNTLDIEQRTDELGSPAALAAWLKRNGLLPSDAASGSAEPESAEPANARPPSAERRIAQPRSTTFPSADISHADLDRALTLREALRDVLVSHLTPAQEPPPTADLRSLAASLPTRLEITRDGRVTVAADGSSGDGAAALARILLIAAEAATLGTWARLKVCSADDCRWAFYDRSPTRSGHWCSMRICGSRAKSRAYRRRTAPTAT